ncbi:hypothetical protein PQO01_14325 [Lentisphaera marina]|uniref:hypothetical protein n=1 Tax=Lentisphaera marina TaxID=1111041 RepID=UPI00236668FF|nr:hypothetical protein [Lentisphaera marina]MDD7986124.1 hypothetical protein [Lentisphaera marina]
MKEKLLKVKPNKWRFIMKYLIGALLIILVNGCVTQNTPGELLVIDYNDNEHRHLLNSLDYEKIKILEDEINDRCKRGNSLNYYLESVTLDIYDKSKFKLKKISTEINSYKEISFNEINDSINLLVSEYKQYDELNYSKALNRFRYNLNNYNRSDEIMIFNINKNSLYGNTDSNNAYCVMEAFDDINHNVLLIEITQNTQKKYWVHYKNLFDNIMCKRNLSYSSSGWLKLSSKPFKQTEFYTQAP